MEKFDYIKYVRSGKIFEDKPEKDNKLITESKEEVDENLISSKPSKMKVSELKAKIREEILINLSEKDKKKDKEEEEVEDVDVEDISLDDIEAEMGEEPEGELEDAGGEEEVQFSPEEGLTQDEKQIQDSLKLAYDNAIQIGDDKLAKQIGNTITFFTRSHVVGGTQVAEDDFTGRGIPDSDIELEKKPDWRDIGDSEEEDKNSGLRRSKY